MSTRSLANPKVIVKLSGTVTNTLDDASTVSVSQPSLSYSQSMADGISDSQANRGWQSKSRSLTEDSQEIIDLYNFAGLDIGAGDGNDAVGQALTLEEIVAIAIVNENDSDELGTLEILPSDSEGWTPIGTHTEATQGALLGQGMLLKVQPAEAAFDVSEGSHRITLRAVNGAVDYSIYVLGRHDDDESSSSSSSISTSSSSTSSASSLSSSSSNSSSLSSLSSSSASSSSSSSSSVSTSSISTSSSSISTSSSSGSSNSSSSSSSISTSSSSASSLSSSSSVSTSSSSSSSSTSSESSSSLSSISTSSSSP